MIPIKVLSALTLFTLCFSSPLLSAEGDASDQKKSADRKAEIKTQGEKEADAVHQKAPDLTQLTPEDLSGMEKLSEKRRSLIELALKTGRDNPDNHYLFGSADPKKGGFDCSGAMYYLLQKSGFTPPRTSAGQFDWIKKSGNLTIVPEDTTSLDVSLFKKLRPGDLLFWSHTYHATDGRTNGITHVQMYLGKEKKDGWRVMVGSSDGRSYRGNRQDGYAVFDFKLPHQGSKQKFVGFGSPPKMNDVPPAVDEPTSKEQP